MPQAITLGSETLRLRLDPGRGASVLSLELQLRGAWVDLWRRAPEPLTRAGDAASFLLAPWSNRIRDGRFRFGGRAHALRHGDVHAIHGDVRERAWQVVEADARSARLALDARALPDRNFPFPYRAETWTRLDGAVFEHGLAVENAGAEPMPAGLGFHPYWLRALGGANEDAEVSFRVAGVYPGVLPVPMLPTGPPVALVPAQDFSTPRRLDVVLDHCFAGWEGRARVRWPRSGVTATLEASPALRHLVVYSPAGKPFFAIEPVSHANDAFNLAAAGMGGTGVVALAPGARLEGSFRVTIA